jgi:hypothetical protein
MSLVSEYKVGMRQIPDDLKHLVKIHIGSSCKFTTYTYTVKANGKPDDEIYATYPILVQLVPRGYSQLFMGDRLVITLSGLEKFTATTQLDDDAYEESRVIITDSTISKQWEDAGQLSVTWLEKANGKFLTFVLFEYLNTKYLFGGSKTQHVVCELFRANGCFMPTHGKQLHYVIIDQILSDLSLLHDDQINLLMNQTVIGEYVDGNHLVYVDKPYAVYFNTYGTCLPTVKHLLPEQKTMPTVDQLQLVRQLRDTEGVVIVYRNIATNEIIRQKHKTIWYIILRSWREVICQMSQKSSSDDLYKRVARRTEERANSSWLQLPPNAVAEWLALARLFCNWLPSSLYMYKDLKYDSVIGMARVMHAFNNRTEEPAPKVSEPVSINTILLTPAYFNLIVELAKYQMPVTVVMSGLPGSGKTTVANMLISACTHTSVERFSTDDLFITNGKYQFDPTMLVANHKANYQAFCSSTALVKIVDNTSLTPAEYNNYFTHTRHTGGICILLATRETDIDVLSRNVHNVTRTKLKQMAAKRKEPLLPSYYGAFIRKDLMSYAYEQKSPLHVTCAYVGGNAKTYMSLPAAVHNALGHYFEITIKHLHIGTAGNALIVETLAPCDAEPRIMHITLTTNASFKPADVGKELLIVNASDDPIDKKITSIYALTW